MSLLRQQTLYNQLLGIPLFCGMSRYELEYAVQAVGAGFQRIRRRTTLAECGQPCRELFFLLEGTMEVCTPSADGAFCIVEYLSRPTLLGLPDMFSLAARHRSTITAAAGVALFRIAKPDLLQLADRSAAMHINLLHILARCATRQHDALWQARADGPRARLAQFLRARTIEPAGRKDIIVHKPRLAAELGLSRAQTPQFLEALQAEGLATPKRGMLVVHDAAKL